jgi:predicted DCC family thiol-disulfide oxidoreductase YuxK
VSVAVTVLYDDDCGLCRAIVRALMALDRAGTLRFVALQSTEAEALTPWLSDEQREASVHAVLRSGEVLAGGAAAAPVLRDLPGGAPLARLAERLPTLTERGYRVVADNRTALGRLVPGRLKRPIG